MRGAMQAWTRASAGCMELPWERTQHSLHLSTLAILRGRPRRLSRTVIASFSLILILCAGAAVGGAVWRYRSQHWEHTPVPVPASITGWSSLITQQIPPGCELHG